MMPQGAADEPPEDGSEGTSYFQHLLIPENESVVWENLTVIISGVLEISGTLELRNTTLILDGQSEYVMVNGTLNITDLDGNPGSRSDSSMVLFNGTDDRNILMNEGSRVNIGRSFLRGLRIGNPYTTDTRMSVTDTEMENCTLYVKDDDKLKDLRISGSANASIPVLESYSRSLLSISDIMIADSESGIRILQGSLELVNLTMKNCSGGIYVGPSTTLYLRSSLINGSELPISSKGGVELIDSIIESGKCYFDSSPLIARGCHFRYTDGLEGVTSGLLINSTFDSCSRALVKPRFLTITLNRFVDCTRAVIDDSDCLLYHNSFRSCKYIVEGQVLSSWYNQDLREGNHYSSYRGLDDGTGDRVAGDGIGDTDIPYLGRDMYPLMKDRFWLMPDIPDLIATYSQGSSSVNLTWTEQHDADGYLVQRSTSPFFDRSVTSWSVRGNGLVTEDNPNATLHFRVSAFNEFGYRGWSRPSMVRVDQAPLPPVNIRISPVPEGGALLVSWEFRGEDVNRTYVLFGKEGGFQTLMDVPFPENRVTISGLLNNVSYNISLMTVDGSSRTSGRTENISAVPTDSVPPPPPRSLRATPKTNNSIEIMWDPPLIQDISHYRIMRRSGDSDFVMIAEVSRLSFYYLDTGLSDNTSYEYGAIAVDDDGPTSEMAGPVRVRTLHYNREPVFNGNLQLVSLVEDGGPFSIPLEDVASDPDGDTIVMIIQDSYPFPSRIENGMLIIEPRPDQAGEGFVRIQASDGEESSFLIVGVIVQEVPDPPSRVSILSPINGSVLIPGVPVLFHADAADPDIPYGDNLTFRWFSDRDGALNILGSHSETLYAVLSPGEHRILLEVRDNNNTPVTDSVTIMVSIWGWNELPWSAEISEIRLEENGGWIKVRIVNDAPIRLSYLISPADVNTSSIIGERGLLVAPASISELEIPLEGSFAANDKLNIRLLVTGEALNGTYAGEMEISASGKVRASGSSGVGRLLPIILLSVSLLLVIFSLIVMMIINRTLSPKRAGDNIDEEAPPSG